MKKKKKKKKKKKSKNWKPEENCGIEAEEKKDYKNDGRVNSVITAELCLLAMVIWRSVWTLGRTALIIWAEVISE